MSSRELPRVVTLSELKPQPVRWLWPERVPLGKVTLIAGDPGLGKSLITVDIASRVSIGARFPLCGEYQPIRGTVLFVSGEDDPEDTVLPRVLAAGGDPRRIAVLASTIYLDQNNQKVREEPITSIRDDLLASALDHLRLTSDDEPALLVVDPISAFMGSTDSHNNADVRAVLAPLSDLAQRYGIAVVLVSHLNKGSAKSVYRVSGSLAFVAAARIAHVVAKSSSDPSKRLFVPTKSNLGVDSHGLSYSIESAQIRTEVGPAETAAISWDDCLVSVSADEALAEGSHEHVRQDREDLRVWMEDRLDVDEPASSAELVRQASEELGRPVRWIRKTLRELGYKAAPSGHQQPWHYTRSRSASDCAKTADTAITGRNDDSSEADPMSKGSRMRPQQGEDPESAESADSPGPVISARTLSKPCS